MALPRARATSELKKFTPNLSSKLREDGKLMPQEHQHISQQTLPLCGLPRPFAKDCPKSSLLPQSQGIQH